MDAVNRIAHDLICIIKYNSPGGTVTANELKRVTEYMERVGLIERTPPPLVIMHNPKVTAPVGVVTEAVETPAGVKVTIVKPAAISIVPPRVVIPRP